MVSPTKAPIAYEISARAPAFRVLSSLGHSQEFSPGLLGYSVVINKHLSKMVSFIPVGN